MLYFVHLVFIAGSRKLTSSVISSGDTCVVTKDDDKITVDWGGSKTLLAIDKVRLFTLSKVFQSPFYL